MKATLNFIMFPVVKDERGYERGSPRKPQPGGATPVLGRSGTPAKEQMHGDWARGVLLTRACSYDKITLTFSPPSKTANLELLLPDNKPFH